MHEVFNITCIWSAIVPKYNKYGFVSHLKATLFAITHQIYLTSNFGVEIVLNNCKEMTSGINVEI